MARVVVVGAGMVGAACAYYLARDGHDVTVIDRGPVGGGTTSRGEGNILVSDKAPGPELDLALWSARLWRELGAELGTDDTELEPKGGLVVATSEPALATLRGFAEGQQRAGVACRPVAASEIADYEPHVARGMPGAVFYPDDQQVQPVRAAAALIRGAAAFGAHVLLGREVRGIGTDSSGAARDVTVQDVRGQPGHDRDDGDVRPLSIPADVVVNAAGTWGGELSGRLGAPVPVLPRRGFILVTEPLPVVVHHKVYTADYVANVASSDEGLETSVVVEGTRGGTVLIGASRERVGFDAAVRYDVIERLAAQAVRLFPGLAGVALMRVYHGFRPYCPDHLPVIGADPRVPGVFHACGHEGAGIGLAPATGSLIAAQVAGRAAPVAAEAFSPSRFAHDGQEVPAHE